MTHPSKDNPNPEPSVSRDGPAPHDGPAPRDGVDSWLDVLTSMLALPPSQRAQVRDELEDHLRSRVDDLLIAGKPEPEAIRTAIAELGETAQLARHISSANRTPKSFRRFAMNATFFVLAGSILTAGVSMMMPTNTNITHSGATDAIVAETAEVKEPLRHSFNHEREPAVDVLQSIATAYGLSFRFSDGVRKSHSGKTILSTQLNTFKGDYTLQEAVDAIQTRMHMTYGETVLAMTDTELILMTLEEHRRMQVEIHAYPFPAWAASSDEQLNFAFAVEQLIKTKHDLDYTTIQSVNGTLVVAASPEVHEQIVGLDKQLDTLYQQSQQATAAQREARRANREHAIAQIKDEYLSVRTQIVSTQKEMQRLADKMDQASRSSPAATVPDPEAKWKEIRQRYEDLSAEYQTLNYKLDELKSRYEYLESKLIESEYEELIALLD